MSVRILRLNSAGTPMEWLSWQEAVCLHARELVSWTYGEELMAVHGILLGEPMGALLNLNLFSKCIEIIIS